MGPSPHLAGDLMLQQGSCCCTSSSLRCAGLLQRCWTLFSGKAVELGEIVCSTEGVSGGLQQDAPASSPLTPCARSHGPSLCR